MAAASLSSIARFFAQPIPSGIMLASITIPSPLREYLLKFASKAGALDITHLRSILLGVFLLGIARQTSRLLDKRVNRNWAHATQSRWNFPDEIVVITGGCGGIGKTVARLLSARGVKVAVLDQQSPTPDISDDPNIHYFHCDVTSQSSVKEAANNIRKDLGQPSVLINNAGISHRKPILDLSRQELEQTFQVNIISHWTTCQEFLPAMVSANKGHVVAMASMAAFGAMPLQGDYAATKSGILAFHECLTGELKHVHKVDGVLNSLVCPAWTRTPIIEKWGPKVSQGAMEPERVATRVVQHIMDCIGGQSFLPESLTPLTVTRALPLWLQAVVRDAAWKMLMNKA
ncbi:short-chain dehydrogenase/reductase 2 [Purpureocillium lavendulum]|uniref:Short-chain dehydrogenase/reductase 3 n=1 Tax=Purpureocillium lavendulum TaxID=1247861 RepID=A0AB34FSB2_9HYPO|nr:short-chain dehydrogenase/reductase 2 [Purpureocillium lavendulum]